MGMIHVENIGKAYKQYPSRWGRLYEWIFPFVKPRHGLKWVLRDISFTVHSGEVVGILGVNGAGKSTLLKILTGNTQPTTGSVTITGRLAALLELGMGFHPDFTGRQNAVMAGQIIGFRKEDIENRFDELQSFAEIGSYFDEPLRVYSSGMQVRLAFSVATLFRPDILIIDEALSVGDAYFQVKCFSRIKEFKRLGTTILFVSHDVGSVKALCDRAILLSDGRIERDGKATCVADYYSALITNRLSSEHITQENSPDITMTRSGTKEVEIISVEVRGEDNQTKTVFLCGDYARVDVRVKVNKPIPKLVQGFLIRDRRGNDIFGTNTFHLGKSVFEPKVGDVYRFCFGFRVSLGEGVYSVSVAAVNSDTVLWQNYYWVENAVIFRVINSDYSYFIGVANLEASCKVDIM